jgi:RNA polymerase sigma-70 factor (ECF subfamily)
MSSKQGTKAKPNTGNPSLVSDLFEKYYEGLFRFLYYRVGDTKTAEDLTSEVFLRMIKALPGLQEQSISFQAWLFQIARNLAIDHYRKTSFRKEVQLDDGILAKGGNLDDTVEKNLSVEKLYRALARLPENQRDVVILRFIVSMPVGDVALMLHKSEDSVKGLQRRGLTMLKELLTEWEVVYV